MRGESSNPFIFGAAAALVLLLLPVPASAQEVPEPLAPDLATDHAVLSPTALTLPAGSVTFASYDLVGVSATFVPVDRLQLTAAAVVFPPASHVIPYFHVAAKVRLVDWGRLHLAGVAFAGRLYSEYTTDLADGGGLVATVCAGTDCRWAISTFGNVASYRSTGSVDDGGGMTSVAVAYGASAVGKVSPHWRLIIEAMGLGQRRCNLHCENKTLASAIVSVGPRLVWGSLVADLALMTYVEEGGPLDVNPLPWLAISYRVR